MASSVPAVSLPSEFGNATSGNTEQTTPTVRPPPGLPFALRVFLYAVVIPAALVWPSKRRPVLRLILWSRWRLALVRLRYRLRGR